MIKDIIWKDIRLLAVAILGQLVVMLIPPGTLHRVHADESRCLAPLRA